MQNASFLITLCAGSAFLYAKRSSRVNISKFYEDVIGLFSVTVFGANSVIFFFSHSPLWHLDSPILQAALFLFSALSFVCCIYMLPAMLVINIPLLLIGAKVTGANSFGETILICSLYTLPYACLSAWLSSPPIGKNIESSPTTDS